MKLKNGKHKIARIENIYRFLDLFQREWKIYNSHFYVDLVGPPKKLHFVALNLPRKIPCPIEALTYFHLRDDLPPLAYLHLVIN